MKKARHKKGPLPIIGSDPHTPISDSRELLPEPRVHVVRRRQSRAPLHLAPMAPSQSEDSELLDELPKLRRDTLQDQVYNELRDALISGRLRPGEVMTLRTLAKSLGISAMPVRDAIGRLAAERALDILPNRYISVPQMSWHKFAELRDVRCALEGMATERAATLITAEEQEKLRALNAEMKRAAKNGDAGSYLEKNREFHFTLYEASRSVVLPSMIKSLWLQVGPFINYVGTHFGLNLATKHHSAVVTAMSKRDGTSARDAIVADVTDAAKQILGYLPP